jgi:hypothetical protein
MQKTLFSAEASISRIVLGLKGKAKCNVLPYWVAQLPALNSRRLTWWLAPVWVKGRGCIVTKLDKRIFSYSPWLFLLSVSTLSWPWSIRISFSKWQEWVGQSLVISQNKIFRERRLDTLHIPLPIWSPKSSNVGPAYYLDGWPPKWQVCWVPLEGVPAFCSLEKRRRRHQ